MNGEWFDALIQSHSVSRRGTLRTAVATVLAGPLLLLGARQVAATCRKNGRACRRGNQCCSGICKGKQGAATCRAAPAQGICTIEKNICLQGDGEITSCGTFPCSCHVTAQGASLCGHLIENVNDCAECASCLNCEGTVCVRGGPFCQNFPFACVKPCPD
jgi:hypothetical protein